MFDMLQLVACLINPLPGVDSEGQVFDTRQAKEAGAKVSKKTTGVSVKELLPRSRG